MAARGAHDPRKLLRKMDVSGGMKFFISFWDTSSALVLSSLGQFSLYHGELAFVLLVDVFPRIFTYKCEHTEQLTARVSQRTKGGETLGGPRKPMGANTNAICQNPPAEQWRPSGRKRIRAETTGGARGCISPKFGRR